MALTLSQLEVERSITQMTLTAAVAEACMLDPATSTVSTLRRLVKTLTTINNKIDKIFAATVPLCATVGDFKPHRDELEALTKSCNQALDTVNEMIIAKIPAATPPLPPSAFKLEKIKVPEFTGKYEDWQSFHDLFQATVDKHPTLSGAEKLTYLKSALKGEAASVVKAFQITDLNYTEAWTVLLTRYNNKHEVINAHLRKIDEFKPLSNESAIGLRSLIDAMNECFRSLKVLAVPVDTWDLILIYWAVRKLGNETKKQWALKKSNLPKLTEFLDFLESRARGLASVAPPATSSTSSSGSRGSTSHHSSTTKSGCYVCSEPHRLFQCPAYGKLSIVDKKKLVNQHHLCYNCLGKGHTTGQCSSSSTCRKCGNRHHTSLHYDTFKPSSNQPSAAAEESSAETAQPVSSSHCSSQQIKHSVVLLGTLLVDVVDSCGEPQVCRVFVDPGSDAHFISEQCVDRLGLRRKKTCVPLNGIGQTPAPSIKGLVSLTLQSKVRNFSLPIKAFTLPSISGLLPASPVKATWPHLKNIQLSDPQFHSPSKVDILLSGKCSAWIKLPQMVKGPYGTPVAENTQFGWMLSGEVFHPSLRAVRGVNSFHAACGNRDECVDVSMSRFWELEEPESVKVPLSSEDEACEQHFLSTHTRNADGSFCVELPFKPDAPALGQSRPSAVKRFQSVERRLSHTPQYREQYIKSMRDNISLGFMELVPPHELNNRDVFYMPHRYVLKESSTTTKFRVVMDASAKTSTGVSLNEILPTGPKLQVDLAPLLTRFMTYKYAMSADIFKFYPQTHVHRKHVDFQRLVWRESPELPLLDYRMVRLVFGVTSAPFLAIRSLHQLAYETEETYPLASPVIREDFLVDNLLSGSRDLSHALELQQQLISVMEKGNLKLRKWTSNSAEILNAVPPEHRESASSLPISDSESINTIGILWQPERDTFSISVVVPDTSQTPTKRRVLSSIARIFDPLGWLTPVTVKPKILMQEIWKLKLDWDAPLPVELQKVWFKYCEELPLLRSFKLDRWILSPPNQSNGDCMYELHGFSDASKDAYSACAYVRTLNREGVSDVKLVAAKSKVAPIKLETIPRLELCGAVLLTKLLKSIQNSLDVNFRVVSCWTDSTIVLDWLASSKKLPTFVTNRVRKIETDFPRHQWHHVSGEDNPADAASRGVSASAFLKSELWLHGPPWLKTLDVPVTSMFVQTGTEVKTPVTQFINSCSSFSRMRRYVGYWQRFVTNCRKKKEDRCTTVHLTTDELGRALNTIVILVQAESFAQEIKQCQNQQMVKSLAKFNPFLDKNGILRVGGRLQKSSNSFDKKHPILLPKNHNFTQQVVRYYHLTHLHAGPQLLLALIRERFWIVRGPDIAQKIVRNCVVCHRHAATTATQVMGQLPLSRIQPARPFSQCGVDYAGPFSLNLRTGRRPPTTVGYVSLFVCMATKAIHLELASDLSAERFIQALTRFVSRRGLPSDIYCDGGRNFVGANNELKEAMRLLDSSSHQSAVAQFAADKGINFHFNPPYAPHHGGLWEAGVKSMKHHLKRVIGEKILTVEEFSTLLTQVEAILNSRPLCQLSSDPNDFSVLTPGHFLIGDPLTALPHPDLTHLGQSLLSRWQLVQQMSQHFWRRWSAEYLTLLQSRPKWLAPQPNIEPGVLVLVKDDDPAWGSVKWKFGRVVATHPGRDGSTRVCDVKTPSGSIYRRPIVKISPLPIYQ